MSNSRGKKGIWGQYPTVVSLNHLDLRGIATYLNSAGQGIDLVTVVSIVLLVVVETMLVMEMMVMMVMVVMAVRMMMVLIIVKVVMMVMVQPVVLLHLLAEPLLL